MAIGKSNVDINLSKLSIKFGELIIINKGKIIVSIMKLKLKII